MASTKKNAVNKTANRPCRDVAPPDTNNMASTYSSRSIKNGGRVTKTRSKKSKNTFAYLNADDAEDDDYKPSGVLSKSINSEFDHDTVEDSDNEYIIGKKVKSRATRISKQKAKASTKTDNKAATNKVKVQTETQPKTKKDGTLPDPHGRVKGRDLIPWTRPRMFEKLLLHLQYEAELAGIRLPWDAAVHRLHVGSNEGAATQQLAKLREILLTEGHMVPPKAKVKNKRGVEYHPQMRGCIRPEGCLDPYETRIVEWDENIIDRAKSIENPGIYRGSGRYPRISGPGQAAAVNRTSPPLKKPRATRSTAPKSKLMVTLKLNPKHLSMFPTGSGDAQPATKLPSYLNGDADSNITMQGNAESDGEIKNDIGDLDDDESDEQESGSENDNDDEADEISRVEIVKQEDFYHDEDAQEEIDGVSNQVNGYTPGQTEMSLNSRIGGTMNATTGSNNSSREITMINFDLLVGSLTSPKHFDTLPAVKPSVDGFDGHHLMYPSGPLDQHYMYTGPLMLGSNSYVSPAAFNIGTPRRIANGHGMGMETHPQLPQSYYQRSNIVQNPTVGAFQPSGSADMDTGYEFDGIKDFSHIAKGVIFSAYEKSVVGEGDDTEEKPYDSTPSLVYPTEIFGSGSVDDDDDDNIFDSFLQHEIFNDAD